MAQVFGKFKKATYRGIPFLYQSTNESGGFKTVEHLYPGSDNFQIEQLGKTPRKFNIEAKIDFNNRDAFDTVLNTPGSGLLSHPMYGNFIVKVTQYTKNDSKDQLGFYDYTVEFVVEIGLIIPRLSTIALSQISRLRSAMFTSSSSLLKKNLKRLGF